MTFTGNPRDKPGHRERGPKRYHYTVEDIARLAGRSVATIHAHGAKVADLEYVIRLIARARAADGR
jgi:hypothetical protein